MLTCSALMTITCDFLKNVNSIYMQLQVFSSLCDVHKMWQQIFIHVVYVRDILQLATHGSEREAVLTWAANEIFSLSKKAENVEWVLNSPMTAGVKRKSFLKGKLIREHLPCFAFLSCEHEKNSLNFFQSLTTVKVFGIFNPILIRQIMITNKTFGCIIKSTCRSW